MTQETKKLTFEEYISLDAEDWEKSMEGQHEYVDGRVLEVATASTEPGFLATRLLP